MSSIFNDNNPIRELLDEMCEHPNFFPLHETPEPTRMVQLAPTIRKGLEVKVCPACDLIAA